MKKLCFCLKLFFFFLEDSFVSAKERWPRELKVSQLRKTQVKRRANKENILICLNQHTQHLKKGPKTFENAMQRRNPLYIQATQQNAYIEPNPRTAQKGLMSFSSLNAAHVVLFSLFACILSVYLYFLKLHQRFTLRVTARKAFFWKYAIFCVFNIR